MASLWKVEYYENGMRKGEDSPLMFSEAMNKGNGWVAKGSDRSYNLVSCKSVVSQP